MSDEKKVYNTTDPILLAALNAPSLEVASGPKKKSNNGTPYRGISKRPNGKWRAEVGAKGKDYNLGYYDTPEEAALARNYAEELVPGAKKVRNEIPQGKMPDKETQALVARTVVAWLRKYGVALDAPNGQPKPQPVPQSPPAKPQPVPQPPVNKVIDEKLRENQAKVAASEAKRALTGRE